MLAVQEAPQLVDGQRLLDRRDSGLEGEGAHSVCEPRWAIGPGAVVVVGLELPPPDAGAVVVGLLPPPLPGGVVVVVVVVGEVDPPVDGAAVVVGDVDPPVDGAWVVVGDVGPPEPVPGEVVDS